MGALVSVVGTGGARVGVSYVMACGSNVTPCTPHTTVCPTLPAKATLKGTSKELARVQGSEVIEGRENSTPGM